MSDSIESTICPTCNGELREGQCPVCAGQEPVPSAVGAPAEKVVSVRALRRWLVVILVVLSLFSAGYYTWQMEDYWEGKVPNSVLLMMAGPTRNDINHELMRRLEAGKIDERHAEKILALQIGELKVEYQSPFPTGAEQEAVVTCGVKLAPYRWAVRLEDTTLQVNGAEVTHSRFMHRLINDPFHHTGNTVRIPALDPGAHELTIAATVVIEDKEAPEESRELLRYAICVTRELQIEGEIGDYVKLEATKRQTRALSRGLVAGVVCQEAGEQNNYHLYLVGSKVPIGMSAAVWVRPHSTLEYFRVGELTSRSKSGKDFQFMQTYSLNGLPRLERARAVEVRLVPDLNLALNRGHERCFKGVIVWSEVAIRRAARGSGKSTFGDWSYPDEVAKTRIDGASSREPERVPDDV